MFEWAEDKAPRMAAAVAFYAVFSFTPIVMIVLAIASFFFDREPAQREVFAKIQFLVGGEGVDAIRTLIANAPFHTADWFTTVFGLATVIFAATGAFSELKGSLNTIWEVEPRPGLGVWEYIYARILSFAMVMVIGCLLLMSLGISVVLGAMAQAISRYTEMPPYVLQSTNFLTSLAIVTLLFATIYKVMPDAQVRWRHVWLGSLVCAAMFVAGKWLFAFYLEHSTLGRSFGPAGSLVMMILWTYYSCLIFLFGAEVTQVHARLLGDHVPPSAKAVSVSEHERVQQGIPRKADIVLAALEADLADRAARRTRVARLSTSHTKPKHAWMAAGFAFAAGWLIARRQRPAPQQMARGAPLPLPDATAGAASAQVDPAQLDKQ